MKLIYKWKTMLPIYTEGYRQECNNLNNCFCNNVLNKKA